MASVKSSCLIPLMAPEFQKDGIVFNQITFNATLGTDLSTDKKLQIIFPAIFDIEMVTKLMLRAETFWKHQLEVESSGPYDSSHPINLGYRPKYVIFECELDNGKLQSFPIIFSNDFTHKNVNWLLHRIEQIRDEFMEVRGAGFIGGTLDNPWTHGMSESLQIEGRLCDVECIKNRHPNWERDNVVEIVMDSMSQLQQHQKQIQGRVMRSPGGIVKQGKKGKRWS